MEVKAEAQLQQIPRLNLNLGLFGFTRCSLTGNHCRQGGFKWSARRATIESRVWLGQR